MNSLRFILLLSLISTTALFSNGIAIVDSQNGLYFDVLEKRNSVEVRNQVAVVTCTQVLQNNTGQEANFNFAIPLNKYSNPLEIRWIKIEDGDSSVVASSFEADHIIMTGTTETFTEELIYYLGDFPAFFSPLKTVPNGDQLIIEYTYAELLSYSDGKVMFYQKNDISAFYNKPILNQTFDFTLNSNREIFDLELMDLGFSEDNFTNSRTIKYSSENNQADFDYVIEYELKNTQTDFIPLSTSFLESETLCDSLGTGYFSLLIEPEFDLSKVVGKNIVITLDRSGSMHGSKLRWAGRAVKYMIENMNDHDNFNIQAFSGNYELTEDFMENSNENQSKAFEFINELTGGGGTNIRAGLRQSIRNFENASDDKANIIVLITDGEQTFQEESNEEFAREIQEEVDLVGKPISIYTVGLGDDADKGLLGLIAAEHNGSFQDLEEFEFQLELEDFLLSINNPILFNTTIEFDPDVVTDVFTRTFPNLYVGQQTIISGRYKDSQLININVVGSALGVPYAEEFKFHLSDRSIVKHSFLPKVWGDQKIYDLGIEQYLLDEMAYQDSIANLIQDLSDCYDIIPTDFTNLEDDLTEIEYNNSSKIERAEVYPNPCVDRLDVMLPNSIDNGMGLLEVFNAQSQIAIKSNVAFFNNRLTLDNIAELSPGIYFGLLQSGDKRIGFKFSKI